MLSPCLEVGYWDSHERILGMDEAGRGPIAGPLVVAGVIFDKGYENPLIDDSKKLSEKKREMLYHQIRKDALWYQIRFVSEEKIDELNIYAATQQAMEAIVKDACASFVLSDAMPLHIKLPFEAVIKGDQKSISIAAASILAKVSRDHYMKNLDKQYPGYGFSKHKGYPTKAHLEALDVLGIRSCFRKSYGPVHKKLLEEMELRLF